MPLSAFHPLVQSWFTRRFGAPTLPQERAWPQICAGRHVLVSAPTGSGKTLAAFLASLDVLFRQGLDGDYRLRPRFCTSRRSKRCRATCARTKTPLAELEAEAAAQGPCPCRRSSSDCAPEIPPA